MTEVIVLAKLATATQEALPEHTIPETYKNTTPEKRAYIDAKAEVIHMILNGIEWSRFVTVVKQTTDLDKESYHKLFNILKQYHNEVNEIRAKKLARNANPLALIAAAQHNPDDTYYQAPKPYKTHTSSSRHTTSTSSHATTRNKGKEIAKPITPPSESAYKEDNDPEHAQRDKQM
ncbi:hypothetical protein Tco_1172852 [Tanacetum coccineum]